MQIVRRRLTSIDNLPPGSREELTDISHCLADVVISVLHHHQQQPSDQLRREIQSQIEASVALDERLYVLHRTFHDIIP